MLLMDTMDGAIGDLESDEPTTIAADGERGHDDEHQSTQRHPVGWADLVRYVRRWPRRARSHRFATSCGYRGRLWRGRGTGAAEFRLRLQTPGFNTGPKKGERDAAWRAAKVCLEIQEGLAHGDVPDSRRSR